MTSNQINYWKTQEEKRHNLEEEARKQKEVESTIALNKAKEDEAGMSAALKMAQATHEGQKSSFDQSARVPELIKEWLSVFVPFGKWQPDSSGII